MAHRRVRRCVRPTPPSNDPRRGDVIGGIWLVNLPEIFEDAGLDVTVYPGWETRSRSSGGYDALLGIGIHHDASGINSSDQSAWDWAWKNSSDRPIGAIRISRGTGLVCVGAAGATNTMGKGGPLETSSGQIPKDAGNKYMIAIEAGNNGVGEAWSAKMIDAYIRVLAALCQAYDFDPSRDIFTHHSYCEPSCSGRKVDPSGPTPSQPSLGGTSGNKIWSHDDVRHLVMVEMGKPPPEPPSEEPVTDEDIQRIADAVWRTKINTAKGEANTASVLGWTYAEVLQLDDDDPARSTQALPDTE